MMRVTLGGEDMQDSLRLILCTGLLLWPFGLFGDDDSSMLRAIVANDRPAVEKLLAKGYDVNKPIPTQLDYSALIAAIGNDRTEIVRLFLNKGGDPNWKHKHSGIRPLHWAIIWPKSAIIVSLLLDHGADPNATEPKHGSTPLHVVAYNGSCADASELARLQEIVRILRKRGAKISRDREGHTPAEIARAKDSRTLCLAPMLDQ